MLRLLPFLLAAASAVPACGPSVEAGSTPSPGTMRVRSVAALAAPWNTRPNLLPNGNFLEWYAGSPVLRGFDFPGDPTVSEVFRQNVRAGLGGQAAQQVWHGPDADFPPQGLFRSTLRGVKPATRYRVEITAIPEDADAAHACIGVWGLGQGGVTVLARPLLRLEGTPGVRVTRAAVFSTRHDPLLIVGAYLDRAPQQRASVLWLEWRLAEGPQE